MIACPHAQTATCTRAIARAQLFVATIAAVVLVIPSLMLFWSPILLIPGSAVWALGLWLMLGYRRIARGELEPRASASIWVWSLMFNFAGLVLLVERVLSASVTTPSDALALALLLPPLVGTVLGAVGVQLSLRAEPRAA
jgi:hypothetical protein